MDSIEHFKSVCGAKRSLKCSEELRIRCTILSRQIAMVNTKIKSFNDFSTLSFSNLSAKETEVASDSLCDKSMKMNAMQ